MAPTLSPCSFFTHAHRRVVFIVLCFSFTLFGCDERDLLFNGDIALAHVAAQCEMGPRYCGSDGHTALRAYIKKNLTDDGYDVRTHAFTTEEFPDHEGENIYARLAGVSEKQIVVAGHYDTRSVAEKDPDPTKRETPIMGANDGGSSVAVLLELARVMKQYKESGTPLPYSVIFLFFDLEDEGGLGVKTNRNKQDVLDTDWIQGSLAFAREDVITKENTIFGILVDIVGGEGATYYYEHFTYPEFAETYALVWDAAETLGYDAYFKRSAKYYIIDDHLPFARKRVPFINIIDLSYPYHHTHEDTYDKVRAKSLARVGRVVEYVLLSPHTKP